MLKLAARNILRQKTRSAVTLSAIILGVVGLILSGGFVKDIFFQLGEAVIHSQSGHIQVFKEGFLERGSRQPDRFLMEDPKKLAELLRQQPGVDEVSARLNFSGLLNNGRRDLAIIGEGVEASKEARVGSYQRIVQGRQLDDRDQFGILVGEGVANSLGLSPGDYVTMVVNTADGALNTLDFEVVGVFQTFSKDFDARAVRVQLQAAQDLMFTPGANLLVVTLQKTQDTDSSSAAIRAVLPGGLDSRTWYELSDFYDKAVQLYDRQFGVLQLIILFMVLLSVANTVNMSVSERLGEFGTMQALGNTRAVVFKLVVLENVLLGTVGALVGGVLGLGLAEAVSAIGIPMPAPPNSNQGYTAFIRPDSSTVLTALAVGFVATAAAGILPARRVSRTPVVEALRQSI